MARKKAAKCLVIDADIARATGESISQNPISRDCRAFMYSMLEDTDHKVVLTKEIQTEWNKHQSRATVAWRKAMVAQKRVHVVEVPHDAALRQQITACALGESKRKAMLKDVHLLEAALQADKIVISMDEIVRQCFHDLSHQISQLKQIAWVNPSQEAEAPLYWLREGATREKKRCLGHIPEHS